MPDIEKLRRRSREWNRSHPTHCMLRAARIRAKKAGLPFDLTERDVIVPEFCPILGMRLERNIGGAKPNSPSLDRIRSDQGYVRGNVWVISFKANTIKNNATLNELESIVSALKKIL